MLAETFHVKRDSSIVYINVPTPIGAAEFRIDSIAVFTIATSVFATCIDFEALCVNA